MRTVRLYCRGVHVGRGLRSAVGVGSHCGGVRVLGCYRGISGWWRSQWRQLGWRMRRLPAEVDAPVVAAERGDRTSWVRPSSCLALAWRCVVALLCWTSWDVRTLVVVARSPGRLVQRLLGIAWYQRWQCLHLCWPLVNVDPFDQLFQIHRWPVNITELRPLKSQLWMERLSFWNFLPLVSKINSILGGKSGGAGQVGVAGLLVLLLPHRHQVQVQHLVQVDPVDPAAHPTDLVTELIHCGLPHCFMFGWRRGGSSSRLFSCRCCCCPWRRSCSLDSPVLSRLLLITVILL